MPKPMVSSSSAYSVLCTDFRMYFYKETTTEDVLVFTTQPELKPTCGDHDQDEDEDEDYHYESHDDDDEDYQYTYHDDIMEDDEHDEHQVEEHSEFMTENNDQTNYSIIQIEEEVCNSSFITGFTDWFLSGKFLWISCWDYCWRHSWSPRRCWSCGWCSCLEEEERRCRSSDHE